MANIGSGGAYDDNDSLWESFQSEEDVGQQPLVSGPIDVAPAYVDNNAYSQIDAGSGPNNAFASSSQPKPKPPPPSTANAFNANSFLPSSQPELTHDELDRRETNLRAREQQLQQRRERIEAQDRELALRGGGPEYNWPCRWYPLAYHSITDEIPAANRPHMRRMYILVLLTFLALIANNAAVLAVYLVSPPDPQGSNYILLALCFVVFGSFGAWKGWYRQIYYAIRDKRSIRWWVFLFFFFVHCCFCGAAMVGYPTTGLAGWILMINTFKYSSPGGIVCFVSSALWSADFFGSIYYLRKSFQLYRTGGSHQQAQTELMQGIVQHAVQNEFGTAGTGGGQIAQ